MMELEDLKRQLVEKDKELLELRLHVSVTRKIIADQTKAQMDED